MNNLKMYGPDDITIIVTIKGEDQRGKKIWSPISFGHNGP